MYYRAILIRCIIDASMTKPKNRQMADKRSEQEAIQFVIALDYKFNRITVSFVIPALGVDKSFTKINTISKLPALFIRGKTDQWSIMTF